MATGIQVTTSKALTTVRMFEALAAANLIHPGEAPVAAPGANQGFLLSVLGAGSAFNLAEPGGGFRFPRGIGVRFWNTDGTGLSVEYLQLWSYSLSSGLYSPFGIGAGAEKGKLNGGLPIEESDTNKIRHQEWVHEPCHVDGLYLRVGPITAGGSPLFIAEFDFPRIARD